MAWFVYVLISEDRGILYVGMTQDIERRLAEHNAGKSKFTAAFIPWRVVHIETAENTQAARAREKYLKSAAGKRFLKKILD